VSTTTTAVHTDLARLTVRPAYLAAGVALLALAIGLAVTWETGVSSVLLFVLLPDTALLLAIGQPVQRGQLAPRAVPAYNLMHHPAVPTVLLALGAAGALGQYWWVAALAWGAHIAVDRGVGYGLRTKDGWQRG
jgi:hypothetical protein